jgi:hypothetical protein
MTQKNKSAQAIIKRLRAVQGVIRKEHFAAGGSVHEWRGMHLVQRDRKKEANRQACRRMTVV